VDRPAPRADGKDEFAGVFCLGTGGGAYNNQLDRDYVGVFAGIKL
jgi:hypothetical protein